MTGSKRVFVLLICAAILGAGRASGKGSSYMAVLPPAQRKICWGPSIKYPIAGSVSASPGVVTGTAWKSSVQGRGKGLYAWAFSRDLLIPESTLYLLQAV
jgi:hypothetical protein